MPCLDRAVRSRVPADLIRRVRRLSDPSVCDFDLFRAGLFEFVTYAVRKSTRDHAEGLEAPGDPGQNIRWEAADLCVRHYAEEFERYEPGN